MSSHGHAAPAAAPRPSHGPGYGAPMAMVPQTSPSGTFAPGTKIQVGSHRVVIQKYLSEGGFAHVYLVRLPSPVDGTDQAVLKRVAVPDKDTLRGMRTEVETMKRLKGHKAIVTYIDSHASEMIGGGYEVFLLMEYCDGGGLIDFMNTRLQHRLTEPEIMHIFADVAEGVACMHYLKPPLLHRDLKVENVLITTTPAGARKFKLCDFGSAAPPCPAPATVAECRQVDEDVQKHTTMQYRSPEMIDVYRRQPIDEKSDIWALGVLLYKLCYYTTPFEEQGQLAILNASYKFPKYPPFSDRLRKLISSMLRENQRARPNIYQVLREACDMQGRDVPVKDIYSGQPQPAPRDGASPPAQEHAAQPAPVVGAVISRPAQQQQAIPEVERMRRGRPATTSRQAQQARPGRSPAKVTSGDPFAALDSRSDNPNGDELSSRFPTIDQFSLLHDSGAKFDFDTPGSPPSAQQPRDLSQRVAERLADEAFAQSPQPTPASGGRRPSVELGRPKAYPAASPDVPAASTAAAMASTVAAMAQAKSPPAPPKPVEMSRASAIISNSPELQAISSQKSQAQEAAGASRPVMVSTGTMTADLPPEGPPPAQYTAPPAQYTAPPAQYTAHKFFARDRHHRSSSMPRRQDTAASELAHSDSPSSSRPGALPTRVTSLQSGHVRHPSSSRPSLEGARPDMDLLEPIAKSRSTSSAPRPRPASTHLESNIDYLRERESWSKPLIIPGLPSPRISTDKQLPAPPDQDDEGVITSNVDFLRSMEDSDPRRREKSYNRHGKKSSLSSLQAGTKNIFAGKFSDAFKRFEGGPAKPRTPSPLRDLERRDLTPITGSDAAEGQSDHEEALSEADGTTPEMRRELERRRLSEEEQRVAAAAAEYRQRVQGGSSAGAAPLPRSIGGVSRAVSIQNKVQSLLDEGSRSTGNVARTAQGYGPYSDAAHTTNRPPADGRPAVPRKPASAAPLQGSPRNSARVAPQDPGSGGGGGGGSEGGGDDGISVPKTRPAAAPREQLVAVDLPGQPAIEMSAAERDDYIRDFQRRFPSLTSIEMVERDLAAEPANRMGR